MKRFSFCMSLIVGSLLFTASGVLAENTYSYSDLVAVTTPADPGAIGVLNARCLDSNLSGKAFIPVGIDGCLVSCGFEIEFSRYDDLTQEKSVNCEDNPYVRVRLLVDGKRVGASFVFVVDTALEFYSVGPAKKASSEKWVGEISKTRIPCGSLPKFEGG